ncbi:MAG: haloacid dehalogenase type II [Betaproteobacteria bacterium]|nr:haloacid dehalogenase type II [Betaproteobacteria bacterium]MDH5222864.1 haloacid dehalogenase type II [Betaproteobacteria bacterium]MDH5351591.1 haloacid dehalogenase type II [Betaproteobacteria bacterium]
MSPQALVFDAYGTLYDVHSVIQRCDQFWPGRGTALSQLWRTKQLEYTWQRSLMRRYAPFSQVTREALAYACQALKLPLASQQEDALMQQYLALAAYADVPDALASLRGRKAILSNGSPDMLDPLVKHSGLAFDAVLSVDAVKVFKPAPEVYQLAVDRLGVPKDAIGFVSSNCWDALGAKSFGFRVYWINRTGAPVDRLGFQPDGRLASLGDLPEVLH